MEPSHVAGVLGSCTLRTAPRPQAPQKVTVIPMIGDHKPHHFFSEMSAAWSGLRSSPPADIMMSTVSLRLMCLLQPLEPTQWRSSEWMQSPSCKPGPNSSRWGPSLMIWDGPASQEGPATWPTCSWVMECSSCIFLGIILDLLPFHRLHPQCFGDSGEVLV